MSTSVIKAATATAVEKKRSAPKNKKRLIFIDEEPTPKHLEEPTPMPKSIWLQMRRSPKVITRIAWEDVEDISDDENDTPQAAGKRLSQLKASGDRMRYDLFLNKLEDFQDAGLFMNW